MNRFWSFLICLLVFQAAVPAQAGDGDKRKKKKQEETTEEAAPPATPKKADKPFKTIEEVTAKCEKQPGFFTIYQDTVSGKAYIEIGESQLGSDFLYFKQVADGVLDASYFRGAYRDQRVFRADRYFDRIEWREINTAYWFDPENALSRAAGANINEPVVLSEKIAGMTADSNGVRYLIEADDIFLGESINQVKPSSKPGSNNTFNLGKLNKSKSRYLDIRNYPENTDVVVEYAFENPYPTVSGSEAVTNARYVALKVQHSFIDLPESDFRPRYNDDRVGYFIEKITDQTSPSVTPYRDVIKRWHLVKQDPEAEISDPVEPIVWWVENTTPVEWRDAIVAAALRWNEAFESAGFSNALEIRIQPDTADWDAGDIRYNVLRWTSSPVPPFGGYGPTVADPRTGRIIGGDIMLEYVYLTNRIRLERAFDRAALAGELDEALELALDGHDEGFCAAGLFAHYDNLAGQYALEALGAGPERMAEMTEQSLYRLVLHELGHTLGLAHNFCGSSTIALEDLNDRELGDTKGITSTVMDYHATNLAASEEEQGYYSITRPGVYDHWAIEYGYRQFPDEASEREGLAAILARSTDPELCYGNDADDMRSVGRGIDPRINVSDLSADPVGFCVQRMDLVRTSLGDLPKNLLEPGASYHELRSAYLMLTGWYGSSLNIVSRQIGGVHTDRSRVGQEAAAKPLVPVPYSEQKRAMKVLADYAFSPEAFRFDDELLPYLKMQLRGWDHRGGTEDPKLHGRVLNMQQGVLNHLLYPGVMNRLTDTELYGNTYSVAEMLGDLTAAIFDADLNKKVNGYRQNLQLEYVKQLGRVLEPTSGADHISRSGALYQLKKIRTKVASAKSPDEPTRAHRAHVLFAVDSLLDTN